MPRKCTVCAHPRRRDIEVAIATGQSYRAVARQYGTTKDALRRHLDGGHMAQALARAEAERASEAGDVLDQLQSLRVRALAMLAEAEGKGDVRAWAAVAREVRECLELQAELLGQLRRGVQVGVVFATPAWRRLSTALVEALAPYPEARGAVVRVLSEVAGNADGA